MEYGLIFLVLGVGGAFFMAFNNGANDVANAFASAVGSKALRMRTAVLIASFVTFMGALLLGGNVATRLVTGLIPPSQFEEPTQYVLAMITVMVASGIFVLISTMTSLPVSSSQAIVGSLTGVAVLIVGWEAVRWDVIGLILAGWVCSPLIAGVLSFVLSRLIERRIIGESPGVLSRVKNWLPLIVALTITGGIYALFTLTTLKTTIGIDASKATLSMRPWQKFTRQVAWVDSIEYRAFQIDYASAGLKDALQAKNSDEVEKKATEIKVMADQIGSDASQIIQYATDRSPAYIYAERWHLLVFVLILFYPMYRQFRGLITHWVKHAEDSNEGAQEAFKRLQVGTSCYVAFAIGSNDVANSISPVLAIFIVVQHNGIPATFSGNVPIWILILGGLGMAVGISMLGSRVIRTLGERLTKINNARGYCVDFSTATTVVGASALGLPVSTTHAATGGILGSGLSTGRGNVRFGVLGKIVVGWLVTIPSSALITVGVFKLLEWIFL